MAIWKLLVRILVRAFSSSTDSRGTNIWFAFILMIRYRNWNNSRKKNASRAWNLRTWFLATFRGGSKLSVDRIIHLPLLYTKLSLIWEHLIDSIRERSVLVHRFGNHFVHNGFKRNTLVSGMTTKKKFRPPRLTDRLTGYWPSEWIISSPPNCCNSLYGAKPLIDKKE